MMKKRFGAVLVLAGLALMAYGCASYSGARSQMVHGNRVTVQGLVKDWQNYTVYFTGHGRGHPSAVLFKPKDDDRVVIADPTSIPFAAVAHVHSLGTGTIGRVRGTSGHTARQQQQRRQQQQNNRFSQHRFILSVKALNAIGIPAPAGRPENHLSPVCSGRPPWRRPS